jgi:hypothetical protein
MSHPFYGGHIPKKNMCDFSKKKLFPPFAAQKKNSKSRLAKFEKKKILKLKNSSVFELPNPKIGGGRSHQFGPKFNFYPVWLTQGGEETKYGVS